MANMSTAYRGPDPSLITLTNELRGHYGNPARTYEFVTGYKSPSNFSGHNPDSNGIVHAVDIFTDDYGNIEQAEGRALAERLRQVGAATNRFSYLIHDMSAGAPRPMIAGQFNDWVWQTYGGVDAHSDHIHVSIADGYWGDPCQVPASVTNNTKRWGVTGGSIKPQTGTITPIQEDEFTMAEAKKIIDILTENQRRIGRVYDVQVENQRRITETREIVKQIAAKAGVEIDLDAIAKAAAAGVAKAMADGVDLDATVTVKKGGE